jgi:hypothetical protein
VSTEPGHEDLAEDTIEAETAATEVAGMDVEAATESSSTAEADPADAGAQLASDGHGPESSGATAVSTEQALREDPAYVDDSGELPLLVPARERFAGLDTVPVTGEPRVDAATARLEEIVALPTSEHVEVYEDVHQRLQDALADADPH